MKQNGFATFGILGIMGILIVLMVVGIVVISVKKSVPTAATAIQQTTNDTQGKYVEHVLDLSGGVPDSQKTTVVIQQSDSSLEKVILPTAAVDAYIKGLPEGTKVISKTSPSQ